MKVFCILLLLVCYVSANKITGSWETVDVKNKDIQEVSRFATKDMNLRMDDYYYYKLANIISARRQVGAVHKYDVKLELRTTECSKNKHTLQQAEKCEDNHNIGVPKYMYCSVKVQVNPRDNLHSVYDFQCSSN